MRLVKPKKFLGQHFLKDLKVAQDIANTVDACPELPVLEVGPGMGVLTQFLLPKGRTVKVVEVDYESVAYLREAYPQLEDHIIEDDFLKMNLQRLFDGQPFVLTGNYPYNISSQIFFKMLDNKDLIPCCTGMIQKDVFVPAFGFAHCFHVYGCNLYKVVSVLFCNDTPQLFAGFAVNGITESNLDNVQQVGFHFLVVFQENE